MKDLLLVVKRMVFVKSMVNVDTETRSSMLDSGYWILDAGK